MADLIAYYRQAIYPIYDAILSPIGIEISSESKDYITVGLIISSGVINVQNRHEREQDNYSFFYNNIILRALNVRFWLYLILFVVSFLSYRIYKYSKEENNLM